MKNKFKFLLIFLVLLLSFLISNSVRASDTNGTIDASFRYAWGENVGWIDFGSAAGNVHVTDSALSGSAYGENVGWIDLSTITNNNEGTLSGYAWGENVGWIDFSQTTIGTNGVFAGGAYGENIGWITFGTGDNKVATDWRPASSRPSGISSSGSRPSSKKTTPPATTDTPPDSPGAGSACNPGDKYSSATGLPCVSYYTSTAPQGNTLCFITMTLRQGYRGEQVKCLQGFLRGLVVDGIFGQKTKSSVVEFQKFNNLVPDGIVGPITGGKINDIIKNLINN